MVWNDMVRRYGYDVDAAGGSGGVVVLSVSDQLRRENEVHCVTMLGREYSL